MTVAIALIFLANAVLLVPVAVFAVEVFASLAARREPASAVGAQRPSVAVLVPAHQEEGGIAETVSALSAQLRPGDRLLVVADNCTDATARLAREAGAEVIERTDPLRRGKGFALDFGVRQLEGSPLPVVIVVDADCTLRPGSIDRLAHEASASGRPVQGRYLMSAPPGSGLNLQVAELAFLIKNRVRPAGLRRLGLPCHLTGTGMAFPWEVIRTADLAHDSLVEDMKLGLDLALTGTAPTYCDAARIDSHFPYSKTGAASQRKRWEEGHIGMIALALRRLPGALAARRIGAVALALDILVPPLSLLVMLVVAAFVATVAASLVIPVPPLVLGLSAAGLVLLFVAAGAAWLAFGRQALPPASLPRIVPYVLGKLGLYGSLAAGSRSGGWIRTDRTGPDE